MTMRSSKNRSVVAWLLLVVVMLTPKRAISLAVKKIAVVGGGASGMFAAIAAASSNKKQKVVVFEASSKMLAKVKISGGGRCNVLHDTTMSIPDILEGYPRGRKELLGLWTRQFSPTQAREWFQDRGVELKTEADGRMFPVTDSSQTIIDVFMEEAEQNGVQLLFKDKVQSIAAHNDDGFLLKIAPKGETARQEVFDSVILATGSSPTGYQIAQQLGHDIVRPVPSLFTLNAKHQIKEGQVLHGLSGVSVQDARLTFTYTVEGKKKKQSLEQEGPLLITHHGLSGPATLRLSAFGARVLHDTNYRGDVLVNWAPAAGNADHIADTLWEATQTSPKRAIASQCPLRGPNQSSLIPKRLWAALVLHAGFEADAVWGNAKKKAVRTLATAVSAFVVDVTGKGIFKEEFVKAGGVLLKDIDMKTMQSKKCRGLFFCGEIINVDGITGGFNFMNCWSTGHVAGTAASLRASRVETS